MNFILFSQVHCRIMNQISELKFSYEDINHCLRHIRMNMLGMFYKGKTNYIM